MPTQLTTGDLVTAANWNTIPIGEVAYTQATTDVGSITGTATDITAEVTHTFVSGRIYKVTLGWDALYSTVAGDRVQCRYLVDGATKRNRITRVNAINTQDLGGALISRLACPGDIAAGSRTLKGQAFRHSGTGTVTVGGTTNSPRFLLIEDIGVA